MKKMIVTLSEGDVDEIREGRVFEWDWKTECGEPIKLIIGEGTCCQHCGDEYIMSHLNDSFECKDCEKELNIQQNEVDRHNGKTNHVEGE